MAASRSVEQELLAGDTGYRPVERESLDGDPALPGKPVSGPAQGKTRVHARRGRAAGQPVEVIVGVGPSAHRRIRHPQHVAVRRVGVQSIPCLRIQTWGTRRRLRFPKPLPAARRGPSSSGDDLIATPAHRKERDERGTAFTALCDPHDRATCPPARPPKVGDFPRALIASVGRHPWEVDGHPPRVSGTACQLPP